MIAPGVRAVSRAKAIIAGLLACVLCGVAGLGTGAWLGAEWRKGREAQDDNKALRGLVHDMHAQAELLRQRGVDVAQDFRTAHRRLETITENYSDDLESIDALFAQQREDTTAWLDTRLDLLGCRIGADGVRAWNAASSAGAATAAAAGDPARAAGAVSEKPAATDGGSRAGNGADASSRSPAVPPVPVQSATSSGGGSQL